MEIPRHSKVFRSIAWVVIFTQLFTGSAFADIKVFSKDTLAPQYLSQSNPPDKNAAQETKSIIGITSVLDYIGRRHFIDRRPLETIQRDARDQFRSTPSWLNAIEFKSLKMDGDALTILYKDPEDGKSHQARVFPRDHGVSEGFGIKLRAERPEKGFDRDLRGKDSEPSNDKIIELIKSGNIIEISYSESVTQSVIILEEIDTNKAAQDILRDAIASKISKAEADRGLVGDIMDKVINGVKAARIDRKVDVQGTTIKLLDQYGVKAKINTNPGELVIETINKRLFAHRVKFIERYDEFRANPSAYLVNLKDPVPMEQIVNSEQAAAIMNWLRTHKAPKDGNNPERFIKLRIALGDSVLHWAGNADNSNMSHAGKRDAVIYLGHDFLKYIFQPGNEEHVKDVLDNDEYRHIVESDFKHDGESSKEYLDRIAELEDLARRGMVTEGVSHRTFWGFRNEIGLDLIDDAKDKKERRSLMGTTDLEIMEIDPSRVDVRLALSDEIDFMPNRFNRWDGIVRSANVAKVVVPQERFRTKPLRGVAREEITVPSDEVSDSYSAMRQSIYAPVIKDHLENLDLDINDLTNDPSFIGYVGNGNLLMNQAIVAWKNKVLYTLNGESLEKDYPCLVRFKNGKMAIRRLRFIQAKDYPHILDIDNDSKDITDEVIFASSGISVLRGGADSPVVTFIKTGGKEPGAGVDNELWQDYDIRHYASLPFLGAELGAFGMSQMYPKGGADKDLIARTVARLPVELKYEDSYLPKLLETLARMGYDDAKSPNDIPRFKYFLNKKNSTVTLRIEPALYPHNICVETEDGKIVFIIARGRSSNKGIAIADIPRMLKSIGIKAKNAVVFDNGGDAIMNFKGVNVAPSFIQPPREWIMSMFVFKRNNVSAQTGRKKRVQGAKDEFGKAHDRVRFFRSLYRYVERRKDARGKDYSQDVIQTERFILENSEFIASQLEKALDSLDSYIALRADANFAKPEEDSAQDEKDRYEKEKRDYAAALRKKLNSILAGAILHEEDVRELLKGAKNIADYDAMLRNIVSKLIYTSGQNSTGLKLEESDLKILPEIWRIRFASYFVTFFNGREDPEYTHLELSDASEYIERLAREHKVGALFDMLLAFRRLDKSVRYGDKLIDEIARKTFSILETRTKTEEVSVVPVRGANDSSTIIKKSLLALKDGSLRKGTPNRIITLAKQRQVDLSQMVIAAKTFDALDSETDKERVWKQADSSPNYRNDWIEIAPSAKIIYASEKVVAYLNRVGNIELVVRGNDLKRVGEGKDISRMSVILDQMTNRVIALNISEDNLPLSRTTLAIQLNDSGIFDKYPSLKDVLKTNLVWEEPSAEAREKDIIDLSQIDYALIQRAMKDPAGITKPEDVLKLMDFKYCKTKVIRQYALEALMRIYDTGHPFFTMTVQDGPKKGQVVMDDEKMKMVVIDFLFQDIEEDFRIIERAIKNDKPFVSSICKEVFGVEEPVNPERDIASISVDFLRHESGRSVYKAIFDFSKAEDVPEGFRGKSKVAFLSFTRHDDISGSGVTSKELEGSSTNWINLAKSGIKNMIQRPAVRHWALDYRVKELKLLNDKGEEITRRFNNHICVQANEFIPDGVTLKDVLGSFAYRAAEKREAVRAAAESAIQLYEEAKSALSIGYYIKYPNLEDFVLTRDANSDERWHATIINMNQLAECDSEMRTLRASFSKFPYQDVIDETFSLHIGPDLQPDILKLIVSGKMIEMAGDDGALTAHNLKYSEERSGYPSTAHVVSGDKIDLDKLFTPREQNLILEWMKTRSFNGRQIRFRVATDENNIGLGWETPGEHAAVAANEFSDGCVYISYMLLKEILLKERVALRQSILDEDILGHIKGGAFKPQEDRTEYKIIRGVVDSLKKKASQETDNRNFDVDKVALTKAIAAVKDAETLVFDVDLTIALHRAGQMESSIAEILYKVMTQKNGPKKLRIVTGRSFEELNNTEFFAPLLGLFRKTNATYDIEVYVSEGADKYLVKNGELEKVSGYSKPFTKVEADIIMQVLEESHRKIDREQELSKRGIDKRIINESNVKFSYSPYGKEPSEYDFESDDNEKIKISKKFPERKTRDKLISELAEEINRRGIKDIAGRKGGVSTIGFVRKGVCKKEAVRHILESQKGAKVVYFGDEFGNLPGQLPGNDNVVVDPDILDNYPEFRVVALNDRKEGVYMPKPSRDAMFWVGGFYRGTQEVLKGAYDTILAEDPDEIAAVADVKDMLSRLYGIEESSIERMYRFEKGKGTHERYFKIDTKDKKSYKLVYSNKELFADTLGAARYEVWLINTLGAANPRIPVVPIIEKKRLWIDRDKKWETDKETDGYISKGRDGRYYILYEYMDGDGIAPAPADISGDDPRFRALVENGARMHTVLLGIKKDREAKGLKPYPYSRIYARSGSGMRWPEGDSIIDVADFTAGLDVVCASANKKAPASNPKLAQTKHFILEHSEFIKEQIAVMKKNLRDLYPKLRRLPIHGDWAPHNFLFKNGEVVGMLDWEHSREEAMVFDLVGAIRAGEVNADGRDTGRFNLQDMRTLITTYVEAFNRLNPEDRLRKEEIEALPEIFRCRILYRLSRIANPDRYYEARGFKFPTGTKDEEKAAILMASDDELFKWHVELVTALFNLDEMIRSGNIYGKVVEPLINTVPDSIAGTALVKKTVRKPSAILEECLEQVRSDPKHFSIPFKPLSGISLARIMANPKSVFELVKAKKYRWAKDGYMYTNGWIKLEASDKVFYERENVVIYQKSDDILYVALRGYGDRALKANIGRDQARIKIAVDSRGNIKSITRDNVGEYDLSRSGMALELKDSGVFNDFPELEKALKYQLVWQDIKTDLRVRELRDASVVNLALVKKAVEDPSKLNDAEIRQIEEFVYLKSKILRRMGLDALSRIYEARRIGEDEFREWVVKFIDNDIKEDYRIIERGLKNNRQFVVDIFRNLLGYKNEPAPIDDIVNAEITYTGQDKEKDTFKVQFSIKKKGGGTKRLDPVAFSLIRYEDPAIGRTTPPRPERIPAKMDISSLRQSIELWSKMSDKGISQIAKFGGEFIEWDYRAKTVQLTEGKKKGEARFENNIQVIARQYAPDKTLGEVLKDPALSASEKIAAIEACRICSREFYEITKKVFGGKGYFIENPIPREFAVARSTDGKYSAMIIGLERVADFPNLKMVEDLFVRHMPSPSSIIKPPISAAGDQVPLSLSILYADQAGLRDEVKKAMESGIDSIHIDHFDGTLTAGDIIDCADSIKRISDIGIPIVIHLWTKKLDKSMVYKLMKDGLKPYRDRIVIPYEAFDSTAELVSMIEYIKSKGLEVGISINPETPITALGDIWEHFDDTMNTVTVMCVKPGGGGRAIEPGSFDKVRALKGYIRQRGSSVMIEIDGGITPETYEKFFEAGADSLGARSIFVKAPDMRKRVDEIKLKARSIMREGVSKFTEMVDKIRAEGKDAGGLSFLAVCPMSADIIKAYIEVARDTGSIPTFIATPRQVDVEGSYTGWSQKDFMRILRKTANEAGYAGPIFVERDHGGPWQRPQDIDLSLSRAMANAKRTYHTDMEEGFDILHIDVTLDPMTERGPPVDKMVERTIELIADCEAYRVLKGIDPVAYEIGCDEPGSGLTSPEEVESYLKALFVALEAKDLGYVKKNIIFLVVNTGTNLQGAHQTGRLDLDRVAKFSVIAKHYGLGLKQHYTDYLDNKQLEKIPASGILGVNVGPEFSNIEYEALADLESQVLARIQNSDTGTFIEAVKAALDKTDRWRRWFPNVISISRASAEQQREIVLSCGRYVQEDEQVRSAKQILYARAKNADIADPEKWVIDRIKKSILRYDGAFKVKSALRNTPESLDLTVVEPEKFSKASADRVAAEIRDLQHSRPGKDVTIVFATGNTMVGFLDELSKADGIDWSRLQAYQLDEYKGLTISHPASFAHFLHKNLFSKISIPPANIHYLYEYVGKHGKEEGFKRYLSDMGTPDITMLGIGMDGHLAFNEPPRYSSFSSSMQEVALDDSTVEANKVDYPELATNLSARFAYTIGMADIFASRKIYLLVNKHNKASIVAKALLGQVSEAVPASLLQKHPNTTFILDAPAASGIFNSRDPEPLIGHGFTAEDLTGVEIAPWTVSEQFKRTVADLEGIIRNRSPSSLQKRLLDGLEEFKNGTDGRKMGIIDSHYDDTQHYYLGYGIKSAIGLGKEFFDPKDPLNIYLQEALLHELYQAVMSSGVAGEDIEGESTIHYTALRLQAMLLWNLNDVEQAAIQWMTPSELENHPKNLMKRAIIEWKNRHSPIPERMWKDDWKQLLSELREALNRPERSYKRLADFLVVCNDASISGFRHKYPVESRYPLLRAVTLLDDKERDLLVSVLKSNSKIKRLAISDTILLMLGKGDFDNWLEEQAPELVGRNIYQASSEIWYPGGGLGRVMQYHGEAEYKLLGPYSSQLRQIEPGYHWRRNATGDWTPMDYRSTEVMANPIVTELEEVERFPVAIGDRVTEAIVKRGKNDLGITVYLISDKDGFFTHSLYNYNDDGTNPQLPTWEQFTEFMCRASLELYRRQEEKEMAVKGDAWKAPIFHGNDAQFSLVWIYAMSATYQENGVTKQYADNPVIKATIKAFTTHTYFNREARSGKDGQARLRTLHIPEQYWEKYFKSNRGQNWEEVYDLTSAGLRTADWTGAVARKHMNDVRIYDEWMGLDLRAVTNGDSRARTSSVFRSILSDKSIFPDETVDLEHPTPAQILKAKREAKRRVALKPGQFYTSKPEQNGSILNPDQYVIIYTGRLAREKVDRKRALSDESIEAMVKDGKQVVIYANVQNYQESRDLAEGLKDLVERLSRQNYSGKLVFVPRFGLFDQRALFAAANIGVVGSDPHTEAAGFSETDFASCGALVVAPPWPDGEGILVAQGIKLNFDIEGEGNTLIPEVGVLEQDITQGLVNNETPLRARIRDAYIAIIKRALDMPEEKFAKYMETSYRLSRVLEALPTGAEYLRQFNQTVANKSVVTAQAAPDPAALTQTKDLKGASAPETNPLISKLIADGKIVEISPEESGLKAYAVNYIDGYKPGETDPNKYRGPPVDIRAILNPQEELEFIKYLESHKINGKTVRFRVAADRSALGWEGDIEHANIAHAGYRDGVVYIGRYLLKRMFQPENEILREEVLTNDELKHLALKDHGTAAQHEARIALVKEAIKNIELRNSQYTVNIPSFSGVKLKKIIDESPTVDEYFLQNGSLCSRVEGTEGSYAGMTHYYFNGAASLRVVGRNDIYKVLKNQKILSPNGQYEGSLFIYYHIKTDETDLTKRENAVTVVIRSARRDNTITPFSDRTRGEEDWDEAVIKVYLDGENDGVSMIDYKAVPAKMSLSRSELGILLDDAKLDGALSEIYRLLKAYLVFPDITDALRYREERDNVPVPMKFIDIAYKGPVGGEMASFLAAVNSLEGFAYYKSWTVREAALNALRHAASEGWISRKRLFMTELEFENLTIEEDRLFIQRYLIERPNLIEKIIGRLNNGTTIASGDLASISVQWLGKGKNKNIYRIYMTAKDGRAFTIAVSNVRHNPWNPGFDYNSIIKSVNNWIALSDAGIGSVPKVAGYEEAMDFRPRMKNSAFSEDRPEIINDKNWIRNDMVLVFREFIEGDDLSWALSNPETPDLEKRAMIMSALQTFLDIWNGTKDASGRGMFIGDPKPANVVVKRSGVGSQETSVYTATDIDLDVLREFSGFDEVVKAIRNYSEYSGFDIILKDGKAIVTEKPGRPVNISISLGGTKVGAGVVNAEGEVKAMAKNIQWREVYGNDATADNISEAILRQVASFVDNGDVDAGNINGVGIAFAGPIDEDAGIVGTPFKAPNLPFDHYPLKSKLEDLLKTRFGRAIIVTMYNDSKAALLGEMSPKGLLAGKPSGGIMILGTGVNITVARDGQAYFGVKNEIRELGHNLVAKADAAGVWHYRYTGLETLGDHPGFAPGEMDFEDRNGGPNLDKRFNEASGGKFGIKEITQAAKNRDVLAIELIRQAGEEIGRGIAAFQYAYRSEPFIYNLVLVSSVSENLGKGVMNEDGNDLFMSAVQSAASKELVDMGMAAAEAEKAGRGIVRSAMTYERELVAFTPKTADTPSARIESDMTVIHDMNMDLLPPVDNGKVLYHVIAEELIPVTMTGHMYKLARETENMKMRERIKIVKRKDLESETARLKSSSGNIVLAAVQYKEDLLLLPKDVKALVFTSADGGAFGFKQLEGVIAALRALYRDDAGSLARLYKILTGTPFAGKEMDIAKYLSDPRALAEIIMFNLEPSVAKDPEELKHLNEKLLEFLYKA